HVPGATPEVARAVVRALRILGRKSHPARARHRRHARALRRDRERRRAARAARETWRGRRGRVTARPLLLDDLVTDARWAGRPDGRMGGRGDGSLPPSSRLSAHASANPSARVLRRASTASCNGPPTKRCVMTAREMLHDGVVPRTEGRRAGRPPRAQGRRGRLGQRAVPHDANAGADAAIPPAGAARAASEARETRSIPGVTLRREGDYWTLVYAGVAGCLKDMKGLHYLVHLLEHPGQELHVLDLLGQTTNAAFDQPEVRGALRAAGLPLLDATAKASYRRRLVEVREDLAEAERHHDAGRAQRLREEIEALTEQLAAAVGLGGRDRQSGSAAERARTRVTPRLRTVIRRIAQHHPGLGDHLTTRVRTGTFCSYQPYPERPILWAVGEDTGR